MNQLVEELELDKCDYLDQPGHREQVEKLVEEFHDIFTVEEKKVGMVPDRYRAHQTEVETDAPPAAGGTEDPAG